MKMLAGFIAAAGVTALNAGILWMLFRIAAEHGVLALAAGMFLLPVTVVVFPAYEFFTAGHIWIAGLVYGGMLVAAPAAYLAQRG